jgi:uroporphyrinogen-III synthase
MTKKILYVGLDYPSDLEGEITHCPLIQITPRSCQNEAIFHSLSQFSAYTHILITSKSTIPILKEYLPLFGYSQQDWREKKILAIGQKTAQALMKQSLIPTLIAKEETSEGMIEELRHFSFDPSSFLFWPHSSLSRLVIRNFFQTLPFRWQECSLYDTEPRLPQPLPKLDLFDEIIFTSPSTIDAFLQFFGALPQDKQLTPIGPITKQYLATKQFHSPLA